VEGELQHYRDGNEDLGEVLDKYLLDSLRKIGGPR